MRKNYAKGVLAGLFGLLAAACGPRGAVEYVPQVGNVNYPEAAVWFARGGFPQSWQGQLDTMLGQLELDLYVLSPRGANLADTAAMNPIYREICRQAAAKGVRIGMHVPAGTNPLPEGVQRQQVIFDGTGRLDADGKGKIRVDGWGIRNGKPVGAKVYKVYSYLSRGEGHYEAGSLRDITDRASVRTPDPAHPELTEVTVDGNSFIGGRPVLAMVAYEYEYPDMFAGMPAYFGAILDRFGDVGLTSAALDEFTYLRTVPPWQIGERQYRGRYYSPAMDSAFRAKYRTDMAGTMLAMRMVPERQEQQRARETTEQRVEQAVEGELQELLERIPDSLRVDKWIPGTVVVDGHILEPVPLHKPEMERWSMPRQQQVTPIERDFVRRLTNGWLAVSNGQAFNWEYGRRIWGVGSIYPGSYLDARTLSFPLPR